MTLRALASAAGVSRTAPYRHFDGKEQLLATAAADGLRALRDAMVRASRSDGAGADAVAQVESALNAYADVALARPAHHRLIFGMELSGREHPELIGEGSAAFALLLELVGAALDGHDADSRSALALSAMLWATTHGVVDLTLSGHAAARRRVSTTRTP